MYTSSSKLSNTTEHNNLINRNPNNNNSHSANNNNSHSANNTNHSANNTNHSTNNTSHSPIRSITPFRCTGRVKHNHSNMRLLLGKAGVERVQIRCMEPITTVMKRQLKAGIFSKRATDGVRILVDGVPSNLRVNTIRHMGKAGNPKISGSKDMDGDNSNNNLSRIPGPR